MTIREKVKSFTNITDEELDNGGFCPNVFFFEDDCIVGDGDCKKCWDKEYVGDKKPTVYPMNHIREDLGLDPVNRPAHYTDGKIEVIDYIEDKKLGFCLGNAIKYISRAGKKDPTKEIEDLKKAKWYIERRIKELVEV